LAASHEIIHNSDHPGAGSLRKYNRFRSRFYRYTRALIVYVPECYEKQRERRFPVLYLQDGQNMFQGSTAFIPGMDWRAGQTADRLIAQGAIQPLLMVGIYNAGKQRVREYTPARDAKLGGGGADRYGRMLIEEIKPFIESEYRTLSGPSNTGLGGSSLGGLVTLYLGLRHPDVFGKLAALSPSAWWRSGWLIDFAARASIAPRPRIWLDIGTKEGSRVVAEVARFREILVAKGWRMGVDLHYEEVKDAVHNEAAWAQRVGPFLQFLFPAREAAV
jgi:predicted alpha/beta superfamily hydrolase